MADDPMDFEFEGVGCKHEEEEERFEVSTRERTDPVRPRPCCTPVGALGIDWRTG